MIYRIAVYVLYMYAYVHIKTQIIVVALLQQHHQSCHEFVFRYMQILRTCNLRDYNISAIDMWNNRIECVNNTINAFDSRSLVSITHQYKNLLRTSHSQAHTSIIIALTE